MMPPSMLIPLFLKITIKWVLGGLSIDIACPGGPGACPTQEIEIVVLGDLRGELVNYRRLGSELVHLVVVNWYFEEFWV